MATNAQKIKTANTVMIVAGVAMLGIFLYDNFAPRPTEAMKQSARNSSIATINGEKHTSLELEKKERAYAQTKVWSEEVEQIGPKVLDRATAIARENGLAIKAFRPQRTVEDGKLLRVPFLVTLDGSYPQVASFLRSIENAEGKVAVTMVQLSSSDGVSDTVSATIGLMALRDMAKPEPEKKDGEKPPAATTAQVSGDSHA
ncbi:MAG: type 4a pilus biogenesis protein PilO [Fimbriimonadaceae bacterium]|nr:type 4a pilus biogenesis protein PilO [Fimbriimonadaceae bacterium]